MQSNTATSENQPAVSLDILAEVRQYKTEPFTVRDGRYVGHDGFVVPRDFGEFYKRFPRYIRNWVKKHADRFAQPEDLEDWAQDLTIHLMNLPATSKHRKAGKEDIVETFDASRHYGASQPRFQNYINLCLTNKFRTMHSARLKEPLCRVGNLSLYGQTDAESGEAGDEYCHSRSEHLRKASGRLEQQRQDRCSIAEFADFLRRKDSDVLPAARIASTAGSTLMPLGSLGPARGLVQNQSPVIRRNEFQTVFCRLQNSKKFLRFRSPIPRHAQSLSNWQYGCCRPERSTKSAAGG
jgi:hypothetical protein